MNKPNSIVARIEMAKAIAPTARIKQSIRIIHCRVKLKKRAYPKSKNPKGEGRRGERRRRKKNQEGEDRRQAAAATADESKMANTADLDDTTPDENNEDDKSSHGSHEPNDPERIEDINNRVLAFVMENHNGSA